MLRGGNSGGSLTNCKPFKRFNENFPINIYMLRSILKIRSCNVSPQDVALYPPSTFMYNYINQFLFYNCIS